VNKLIFALILTGLTVTLPLAGCSDAAIPEPRGHMNDFANMINDEAEQWLESMLIQYESDTTNELAVVTVDKLNGKSIEEYTIDLAEKWEVGKKGKDNGAVILVAEQEREVRIEVGYGLEPVLTDAQAKIIIERVILPRFKAGDYTGGIQAGVNAVIQTIEGEYTPAPGAFVTPALKSDVSVTDIIIIIAILIPLFVVLGVLTYLNRQRFRRKDWYSGRTYGHTGIFTGRFGGGGSFGGFGGGGFGGGGAGGRW
jgi:uncharacterized protein